MFRIKSLTCLAVLLAIAAFIPACGGGGDSTSLEEMSKRLYILSSDQGSLERIADASKDKVMGPKYKLTLSGVPDQALWYTDRPERKSGRQAMDKYVNRDWDGIYGDIQPNAAMSFVLSQDIEGLYMALDDPVYDADAMEVTFTATILNRTAEELPDICEFEDAVVNVLNNVDGGKEVSNYLVYAGEVDTEVTMEPGTFGLLLSQVVDLVFQVDNAPGRYSGVNTLESLISRWDSLFKDSPPNAALYGTNSEGELTVFFVTLEDPAYDKEDASLQFTATHLKHNDQDFTPLFWAMLAVDSAGSENLFPQPAKGICYEAFGPGYDPSTANDSDIYFGSDIARKQCGALWGDTPYLQNGQASDCRNDISTLQSMGVNLIRLYDWDPRNDHSQFLDYCHAHQIKVVVPISNWLPTQPESVWDQQVPNYFNHGNYGNSSSTGWHPAVAGVVIANEPYINGVDYNGVLGLMLKFLQVAEQKGYSKNVLVGAPLAFVPRGAPFGPGGANMPCWAPFDALVNNASFSPYKDQLMLCANTYNSKSYLYENAESTGQGWVPLTWSQFNTPILFTEIGLSRMSGQFNSTFIADQLSGTIDYQKANPDKMLGPCHFQFSDKVWKAGTSEGSFGCFSHGTAAESKTIPCVGADFTHWDAANLGTLTIDPLTATSILTQVNGTYSK